MSIISSIFKAFFKPKPSSTQQLNSMLQEISKKPTVAKTMDDFKNNYDQICKIKEKFIDMQAWSDKAPGIMDQLGHMNMTNLDQYSMANFYHDVGAIVYWSLMSIKRVEPDYDIFDLDVIKQTLEKVMKDLAEETNDFEVIDPHYMKNLVEIAHRDALSMSGPD